jgi:hypothetical protein
MSCTLNILGPEKVKVKNNDCSIRLNMQISTGSSNTKMNWGDSDYILKKRGFSLNFALAL